MIKVFIIDDSALVRAFLTEILSEDKDIEVVGQTVDAYFAMNKIKNLNPDIIILDVQMPKMNGLDFLKKVMEEYPTPVVMFSSLTQEGSDIALQALDLGALDYIGKPEENLTKNLSKVKHIIIDKIKSLSNVKIKEILQKRPELIKASKSLTTKKEAGKPISKPQKTGRGRRSSYYIIIGASTGGTRAVTEILKAMPSDIPPIVIVQHMPPVFTKRFADNVNNVCEIDVVEASDGDILESGKAYIAPGGLHTLIKKQSANIILRVKDGPPVNHHKPSVDVTFRSASRTLGRNAVGVILTGMGNDGAIGMKEMKDAGAYNIAQDENTCVVFGMPKEAINADAVNKILPLENITDHILNKIGYK